MQAEIHILHQSDFYEIRDFRCTCAECSVSKPEESNHFFICFVRSGYYEQHVFRDEHSVHFGRILVCKPRVEYTIRHIQNQPDLCTIIRFTHDFYEQIKDRYQNELHWFFSNPDIQSLLINTQAGIELLHQRMVTKAKEGFTLEVDDLVIQLLDKVMGIVGNNQSLPLLPENLKRHHLSTVENASSFLFQNFDKNISLQQLANHCCVSPFHFSRIFKAVMHHSPHQYLHELRLNHANQLLINTQQSITQIAFQSGFNSLEHFTTAYRMKFGLAPRKSRMEMGK